MQIEALPPILVLHLERFQYDATADVIVKASKPVQFAPELEIPIGTIFTFVSLLLAEAKNSSWFCRSRNHVTCFWEIGGARAV